MAEEKLKKSKTGAYYKVLSNGQTRFVKKPGPKKNKRQYTKKKKSYWKKLLRRG